MGTLFILALIVAVAKLWSDVRALRLRVKALEWGTPPATIPQGWTPYSLPEAAQWQPPVDTSTSSIAPATTASAIDDFALSAAVPEPLGHPDLEPGPSFSDQTEMSEAPAQASPELRRRGPDDEKAESMPQPAPAERMLTQGTPTTTFSFEDIFGRKLPIWAGGVTLAVCGFLIVKLSIEAGLISPIVRVIGGLLFGSGLIAGAEAARQNADRVRDPRVAQALSGAGVATLYASVLVATNLYHLIPPLAAFLFMAAITVLAGALSIRFGAPSAVLGLVGGLAAPALVGTGNPNVPLLAAYLSLAIGGLATLGRAQRWWWLGVAAIAGGFGWGMVLILSGALSLAGSLSVGGFLLLLGVGLPVLLFGDERGHLVRLLGTLAATAQLAALVATGGFSLLNWSLFGLLGIASVWLSRREKPLADLPAPALLTALMLMAAWPHPAARELALVVGAAAAICGLPAAWRTWRAEWRLTDTLSICALAVSPLLLALIHLDWSERSATLLALLGATTAGAVAAAGWRVAGRTGDSRFGLLTATAAVLLMTAAGFALELGLIGPVWTVLAAGVLLLAVAARDGRVEATAWATGFAALCALPFSADDFGAFERMTGAGHLLAPVEAVRWAIPALVALLLALESRWQVGRWIGTVMAVLLGYAAAAQVTPPALVPLLPAAGVALLGWTRRSDVATVTAGALAVGWAFEPFAHWLFGATGAAIGFPLYRSGLPTLIEAATRLLAPALGGSIVLWRHPPQRRALRGAWIGAIALLGGMAVHIAWRQLFGIDTPERFVTLGLAERTIWEALLALAAAAAWRWRTDVARAFGVAALAHLAWFSLLLHNPLWSAQAVGALPVGNLLVPVYALGFALLWGFGRAGLPPLVERARGWGQMLLVGLLAASELRQLVQGSLLIGNGLSQAEDIARSIVAVGIAVGFLLWGIRRKNVDWRIASLVVMLGAVLKVFLHDTSGLDGLLRIASFAALGFSLIGIGWLYSRYLPEERSVTTPAATG